MFLRQDVVRKKGRKVTTNKEEEGKDSRHPYVVTKVRHPQIQALLMCSHGAPHQGLWGSPTAPLTPRLVEDEKGKEQKMQTCDIYLTSDKERVVVRRGW